MYAQRVSLLVNPKLFVFALLFSSIAVEAQESIKVDKVDFVQEIKPILAKHCYACHGPDEAEAGLNFSTEKLPVRKKSKSFFTACFFLNVKFPSFCLRNNFHCYKE